MSVIFGLASLWTNIFKYGVGFGSVLIGDIFNLITKTQSYMEWQLIDFIEGLRRSFVFEASPRISDVSVAWLLLWDSGRFAWDLCALSSRMILCWAFGCSWLFWCSGLWWGSIGAWCNLAHHSQNVRAHSRKNDWCSRFPFNIASSWGHLPESGTHRPSQ